MTKSEKLKEFYWNKSHRINKNNIVERQCSKCGEWLEENEENFYYKNKKYPDKGFIPECKKCAIKRSQENTAKKPITLVKANRKRIYLETKDFETKRNKVWRKENREQIRNYQLNYQRNNKDKIKKYAENRQHKNHRISKKEWETCKNYFNNCCAYCGLPIEEHYRIYKGELIHSDLHKEHVDHYGENDLSNCVPSCQSCNCQKWEFTLNEWYNEKNPIYSKERYDKIIKWVTEDYNKIIERNSNAT